MGWMQITQLACIGVSVVLLCVAGHYLKSAGRYSRITVKLRAGEPLSDRERKLLDKARS
jgi:hypothetical protein